ncbi:hypothetical protein LBMAG42_39230 [Deltaproteobacteria bacterium]|nr:hypothetical protein LBMAG42_39230 [Deltaproteobacteria bacterium]
MTERLTVRVIDRVTRVQAAEWDALVPAADPFLRSAFLASVERSGAVGTAAGWAPGHVVVERAGKVVAALPTFLRTDSWGEYIFDHGWANAAHRAGIRYYPKLTSAVPFTPAAAGRVLGDPDHLPALVAGVEQVRLQAGASSHHVLFCSQAEATALAALGYTTRLGFQFHWEDEGFGDFDGFVGRLTSRRRKELLRERRQVREAGVEVRVHRGEDLSTGDWAAMHRFYRSTQHQHGQEGYLPERWWTEELPALPDTLVVLARRGGVPIAGALNFTRGTSLYGRYWGADEEVRGLHFEVCYHALVEWALQNGVKRVEAGAQGEHKLQRGFLPRLTYSAHRIADPRLHGAVTEFCGREAEAVRATVAEYMEHGPFSGGSAMRGEGA